MSGTYPNGVVVLPDVVNHVDVYDAENIKALNREVIALQTYVGTSPQGNRGSLSDRISAVLSGSGGYVLTTAIPVETYPGKTWYRTDLDVLQVVKATNAVQTIGNSFSNVLYVAPLVGQTTPGLGFVEGTLQTVTTGTTPIKFKYFVKSQGTTFGTHHPVLRFRKFTGINTIDFVGRIWCGGGAADQVALQIAVGGNTGTSAGIADSTSPTQVTASVDVSGLNNGTAYDLVISMRKTTNSEECMLGDFIIYGA